MNTHQKMSSLGGDARAASLTPEQRSESARKAGLASAAKRKAQVEGPRYQNRKRLRMKSSNGRGNYDGCGSPTADLAKKRNGQWADHRKVKPSK